HSSTTYRFTLSLHDALPISLSESFRSTRVASNAGTSPKMIPVSNETPSVKKSTGGFILTIDGPSNSGGLMATNRSVPCHANSKPDRKSTRLNSSHQIISYAV